MSFERESDLSLQQEASASGHGSVNQAGRDIIIIEAASRTRTPDASVPAGQPIDQITDPYALEVHRAISVESAKGRGELPELPVYIEREHDRQLREVVQQAVDGSSRFALLVGESSTGKTRACWEAVQALPSSWRLWHPLDPTPAEAALEILDGIGPRSVLWLNEAQHYLLPPGSSLGEQVAAKLRALLWDSTQAPVLVLGTLWPGYWTTLTLPPTPGTPDPHAQARALVTGCNIAVPESFTDRALADLRAAGERDPRLAQAAEHAEQRRITQHLAAAPALLDRYFNASPATKAVIRVAMDARRLGHGPALPASLLKEAAPGYITDLHRDQAGTDWWEQALAYATVSLHGARGPLTRLRPTSEEDGFHESHYQLADYLEQHARTHHRFHVPPASFWEAALRTPRPDDLHALAHAAERRWRNRQAAQLYLKAADAGDATALVGLADLIGGRAFSIKIDGPPKHLPAITDWQRDLEDSDRLFLQAAEAGVAEALKMLADGRSSEEWGMLGLDYDIEGIERLYRQAAEAGVAEALIDLGALQSEVGDKEEAARTFRQAAESGDAEGLVRLANLRMSAGDEEDVERLLRQAADAGHTGAMMTLAFRRKQGGDLEEAERLYEEGTAAGDTFAMRLLVDMRQAAGDLEGAERVYLQSADAGNVGALRRAVELREKAGDSEGAERLGQQAFEKGVTDGLLVLAELRHRAGYSRDAERLYLQTISAGDTTAMRQLADIRQAAGDLEGAERLYLQAGNAGNAYALGILAGLREQAGDLEEAEHLARQAIALGPEFGPTIPKRLLDWGVYGLEPDGRASAPWSINDIKGGA